MKDQRDGVLIQPTYIHFDQDKLRSTIDRIKSEPLNEIVEDAQSSVIQKHSEFYHDESKACEKLQQKRGSSGFALWMSLLLLLGGYVSVMFPTVGSVNLTFDKITSVVLPKALLFKTKIFPFILESLTRIVVMELWKNVWKCFHKMIQNTIDISNVSVIFWQHFAPEWMSERIPKRVERMLRRGSRKLAKKKIQRRVEGAVSRFVTASLELFMINTFDGARTLVCVAILINLKTKIGL